MADTRPADCFAVPVRIQLSAPDSTTSPSTWIALALFALHFLLHLAERCRLVISDKSLRERLRISGLIPIILRTIFQTKNVALEASQDAGETGHRLFPFGRLRDKTQHAFSVADDKPSTTCNVAHAAANRQHAPGPSGFAHFRGARSLCSIDSTR